MQVDLRPNIHLDVSSFLKVTEFFFKISSTEGYLGANLRFLDFLA